MNKDNFYKNKTSPDGFSPWCKNCSIEKAKKIQKDKGEYAINKVRQYQLENYDKYIEYQKNYTKSHSEERYNKQKNWQLNNKNKLYIYSINRSVKNHKITKQEWKNCLNYFNNSCAYCGMTMELHKEKFGQQLHKEHVVQEGNNDLSNCVPSCKVCNSTKNIHKLEDWYTTENPIFNSYRLYKIYEWLNKDYKNYINNK